jgi:hypothetical protein
VADVVIDDSGNVSAGSGVPLALFNSILAYQTADNPLPDPATPDADWDAPAADWAEAMTEVVVKIKRAWAREANAHGAVLPDEPAGKSLIAQPNTTSASAQDTSLTFPVLNGERWHVEVDCVVSCSGIGGVKIGLNGPGGSTVSGYVDGAGASATTWTSAVITALATPVGVFSAAAGGNRMCRLRATIVAGADGDVTFQFASVTGGQTSTIIFATLRAQPVTGV